MEFSKKVILLRKQKGYTQDTFAKEVGVSRQSVYKWEAGQAYPEVEKLIKVSKILEIKIDDLLNDEYVVEVAAEAKRTKRVKKEEKAEPAIEAPVVTTEVVEAAAPVAEEPAVAKEEPKAKRGFFGRLFGR